MEKRLSTWKEIAQYLGVTKNTAEKWHKKVPMPIKKIGRKVTAFIADIKDWEDKPDKQKSL